MGVAASLHKSARVVRSASRSWVHSRVLGDDFSHLLIAPGMRDPYRYYHRLRARGPLSRSTSGAWVVTGHRLCDRVLRDGRFGLRRTPYRRDDSVPLGYRPGAENDFSILGLDQPDHARIRRLAAPAFRPKMMEGYREEIARITHRLLDDAQRRERFDLMSQVAVPLPITVISELLGIPEEDAAPFRRYGAIVASSMDTVGTVRNAYRLSPATRDLEALFAKLIKARARQPREDLLSKLAGDLAAERIGPSEVLALSRILLIAGFETTVNLIGNGTLALLRNPEQWRQLRRNPALASAVVEETLRYDSPVQATWRYAQQDVRLAGRRVSQGDPVYLLTGASGRDPEVFCEPDRFDITRATPDHLAFGSGPHYCLGAPLARAEGEIFFAALAQRLPDIQITGTPTQRKMMALRGLAELPLRTC